MFFDLLFIVLGLVFGSFIAAFSYRYPRGITIAKGRSFCPNCKHKIEWYDNIPLISFIFLGGKCRHCKTKISIRYPLIELATALGFWYIGFFGADYLRIFFLLIVYLILILIFVVDLEHKIIPDDFIFFGLFITVLKLILVDSRNIYGLLFAGFAAASILLAINLVTKGKGMGLGDVKFAILGGAIIGPNYILIWLFLAFLTGAIIGIILILSRKARLKSEIAFGPFLVFALIVTYLFGANFLRLFF